MSLEKNTQSNFFLKFIFQIWLLKPNLKVLVPLKILWIHCWKYHFCYFIHLVWSLYKNLLYFIIILHKNLTLLFLFVAGQVHLLYDNIESAAHGPVGADRERTHPQPVPVVDGEPTSARAREARQSVRLCSALRARRPTSATTTARLLHLHRQLLQQLVHVDRRRERGHLRPAAKAGSSDATQAQC